MIEITATNSHTVRQFYQEVLTGAKERSPQKDISKEDFMSSMNRILGQRLKNCPSTVSNIEEKQFKAGEKVPLDFYLHIGFADSRVLTLLSGLLLEKFGKEPIS